MSGYFATPQERAAYLAGMRQLLDYLEAHPEVPTPRSESLQLSTWGETMADRMETVDEFAALVDAKPHWHTETRTHYQAVLKFGPVEYFCVAIKRAEDTEELPEQAGAVAS